MLIQLNIDPADISAIAVYLNSRFDDECTSPQHQAIAEQTLTRIVSQAVVKGHTDTECLAAFERDYETFGKLRRAGKLPKRAGRTALSNR